MPMYTFICPDCGHQDEEIVPYAEVQGAQIKCPVCQAWMTWQGVEAPALGGAHTGTHQTKAFFDTPKGRMHVSGHFGKDARKKR